MKGLGRFGISGLQGLSFIGLQGLNLAREIRTVFGYVHNRSTVRHEENIPGISCDEAPSQAVFAKSESKPHKNLKPSSLNYCSGTLALALGNSLPGYAIPTIILGNELPSCQYAAARRTLLRPWATEE